MSEHLEKNSKCIVITTINQKNDCLSGFADIKGWDLIIVGDKKSPQAYDLKAFYLDVAEQQKLFSGFAESLPYNHYCRKNLGYAYAVTQGYEVIGESDDDNLPKTGWGNISEESVFPTITAPAYPNVYREFTDQNIWPRGFPLDLLTTEEKVQKTAMPANVGVWQGLADGDSDVDAIYRLTINKNVKFANGKIVVLDSGVVSPFNSQNTIWQKKAFVYLYLPHTVTFRYTDILRSFVAQFGLWSLGLRLGFISPTVSSDVRNYHNYLKDFADEVPMYNTFHTVMETLKGCKLTGNSEDLLAMYEALFNKGIVQKSELETIRIWLKLIS